MKTLTLAAGIVAGLAYGLVVEFRLPLIFIAGWLCGVLAR